MRKEWKQAHIKIDMLRIRITHLAIKWNPEAYYKALHESINWRAKFSK